jgi:hypothetical protein
MNAHSRRRVAGSVLSVMVLAPIMFIAASPASAGVVRGHDSNTPSLMAIPAGEPSLMPVPSGDASLMPIPAGAPSPEVPAHTEDMSGDSGMVDMDDHAGSAAIMPYIATPDAPQRRLVLAGFAVANVLVLGTAAYLRRHGAGAGRSKPTSATPARTPRTPATTDGGVQ